MARKLSAELLTVLVIGVLGLGACSSGSTPGAASATSTGATKPAATTVPTGGSPTTSVARTSDLVVTPAVRSQLVAAGAALNSLPPSDYTGLRPGETYYAYDAATQTYWAAAALAPSPSSPAAQVAAQDDGAYLLFERPEGGAWQAYDVGLAGTPGGSPCSVSVPTAVISLWGWDPGSCRPATIS